MLTVSEIVQEEVIQAQDSLDGGHLLNFTNNISEFSLKDLQALFVDYIYLDTDERRPFAQVSHEYLIEQAPIHW